MNSKTGKIIRVVMRALLRFFSPCIEFDVARMQTESCRS